MNISAMINDVIKKIGKDNTDTLFLIIIIVYFFYLFIMFFRDILNFLISRFNMVTEEIPTKTPYNDSLYMKYCDLADFEGTIIDRKVLEWLIIYFILFVLFWTNVILNKLSIDNMSNEIKILGYSKYYNYDITDSFDYVFLNYLSYYIIITLFLIGYVFIYNFIYENDNMDKEVYRSMYNFNNEIRTNIFTEYTTDPSDTTKKYNYFTLLLNYNVEDSIIKYVGGTGQAPDFKQNKYDDLFGTNKNVQKRLKLLVTWLLAKDNAFTHLKYIVNSDPNKLENVIFNKNCIYAYLSNPIRNVILPRYEDIPYRYLYTNPVNYSELKNGNIDWTSSDPNLEITDTQLKKEYNVFKKRIEEYSEDINRYHQDYTVKYKIWLILFSMSGIIATLFTIIFFLFEFTDFKYISGYINFKDFIMSNLYTIIIILTIFILIVGAIIINL